MPLPVASYVLIPSSRSHVQKFNEIKYQRLKDRVKNMKPTVDNSTPWEADRSSPRRSHAAEKNVQVEQMNKKLQDRVHYLHTHPGAIGKNEHYIPASKRRNPFREGRIVTVRKIYGENLKICQRLQEILEAPGESVTVEHHPGTCPCGQTSSLHHSKSAQQAQKEHAQQQQHEELVCTHCGGKVAPIGPAHLKEEHRLQQTFQIYTNGVKAELDHYARVKHEEKQHQLLLEAKKKSKKAAQKQPSKKEAAESQPQEKKEMPKEQEGTVVTRKVDRIASAFSTLSVSAKKGTTKKAASTSVKKDSA